MLTLHTLSKLHLLMQMLEKDTEENIHRYKNLPAISHHREHCTFSSMLWLGVNSPILVFFQQTLFAVISPSSQGFAIAINAGLNPRGSSDQWHWFAILLIALTRLGHERLFEGCWSPIHICNTFVLIKCSHSMEIGSLTKRLGPRVIRLIVVTVAASAPRRSIFRVAGYWLLKSKRSDQITGWNVMTSCFVQ